MGSTGTNGGYFARQATSRAPTATLSCNLSGTVGRVLAVPTRLQNLLKPPCIKGPVNSRVYLDLINWAMELGGDYSELGG
jgi:hypothetical protein